MLNLQLRLPRLATLLMLALVTCVGAAAPTAQAAATERVTTTTYRVYGSTEAQLRASLDARNPGDYDARTQWFVTWTYRSAIRSGRCVVSSSTVRTRIVFTYPRWVAPAAASDELRQAWSRYMSRLRVHELGHARIGRLAARRVVSTLTRTTRPTCAALDRALRVIVARHFAAGNAADIAYDRRTRHGETQGAVFPAA